MAESLTDQLVEFRSQWLRSVNQVQACGRRRAVAALAALYREQGRRLPPVVWYGSPTEAGEHLGGPAKPGAEADWLLRERPPAPPTLAKEFALTLVRSLDSELLPQFATSVQALVERQLRFRDLMPAHKLLRDLRSLMEMHGELQYACDEFGTYSSAPEFESGFWSPHHEWLSRYAFYRDVCGARCSVDASRRLDCWLELARCCSGFWPYEQRVLLADPPLSAHFDHENRLHHASRPALEYAHTRHWFWRGTEVPEAWIGDPFGVSAYAILASPNLELRRAGIEIVGWSQLLKLLSPDVLDTDPDPTIGQLLEVQLPGTNELARLLKVRCATGREFVLSVPPTLTSARAANAWTYGLGAHEYNLEART